MDVNYHACLFHYMQCILRNRDSHQLRRQLLPFFRRLQVLPLLATQYHAISEALVHPHVPVVTAEVETKLREFMGYWHNNGGTLGRFAGLCDHSANYGSRTTNLVEGFHNKLRQFCPNRAPSLTELLQFLGNEITLAKSRIIPLRRGGIAPRQIQSEEQ